jgi:hypothetical protein
MIEVLRSQAESGEIVPETGAVLLTDAAVPWRIGALGEIQVGAHLAQLGPEWTVLHSVPVGKGESDIDHVVISQAGVFTINTKNHAGARVFAGGHTFSVNGTRQNHVRNSEHEAARASTLLSEALGQPVAVTALIVVVGADALTIGSTDPAVEVLESTELGRWLHHRKRVLTDDAVAGIARAAAQPGTWSASPSFEDTDRYAERFAMLRRQVDAAAHRGRLWASAGTLVALAGLTAFMMNVLPVLMVGALVR